MFKLQFKCIFILIINQLFHSLGGPAMWKVISIIIITLTPLLTQITSTDTGGNWSASGSWIGGVVPSAADDVIIDGPITIISVADCANLIVNNTGTLTNNNSFQTLTVNGNILNNGTVTQNPGGWQLTVELTGNLINNGEWSCGPTNFIGGGVQEVNAAPGTAFSCTSFGGPDQNTSVLATSDISFIGTNINFSNGQLELQSGLSLTITGGILQSTILVGNNAFLETNGGGYLANNSITDVTLQGIVQVRNGNTFTNLTVADTLQNTTNNEYVTIEVIDTFINYGLIQDSNTWGLTLEINGDIESEGNWTNNTVALTGTVDQSISSSTTADFSCQNFTDNNADNMTFINGDVSFSDADIDLAGASMTVLSRGQVSLINNTHLFNATLIGNGNTYMMDATSYIKDSNLSNMVLQGTVQLRGTDTFEDITNDGVIQNDPAYSNHVILNSLGSLVNNDSIQQGNGWNLTINATGNLTNNGSWSSQYLNFTGTGDQSIYTNGSASFSSITIGVNDPSIHLYAHGNLAFSASDIDLGGATLTMADGGEISISNSNLQNGSIAGNGANLIGNGNGFLKQLDCNDLNIYGVVQVRDDVLFSDMVTVVDILQNDPAWYSHANISTGGLFTNNGLVRDNGNGWHLNIDVLGDISSSGTFANNSIKFKNGPARNDHVITSSSLADFACAQFLYAAGEVGNLIVESDITFTNTAISFAGNLIDMVNGSTLEMFNSSLMDVELNGHGGTLAMHNGAYTANSDIHHISLTGINQTRNGVLFSEGVTVIDTLQNDQNYSNQAHISTDGLFTNNGLVRDNGNGWHLNIDVLGDLFSNGSWSNNSITFSSSNEQTIDSDGTATFSVGNFTDNEPVSGLRALSNLSFDGTSLVDLNGATLFQDGSGQLSIINSGFSEAVLPYGGTLYMSGSSGYVTSCTFTDYTLEGDIKIRTDVLFDGTTILNGTFQNDINWSSHGAASLSGTFINNGSVLEAISGWHLNLTVLGNLINNGIWANGGSFNHMQGESYEYIVLQDDQPIENEFRIYSSAGTSGYQWYHDGNLITGNNYITLPTITSADYGTYTCDTNEGPSREVQIGHIAGCTDPAAMNYFPDADVEDLSCLYAVYGCTDPEACNFNPGATDNDGSCQYPDCNGDCGGSAFFDSCNICSEGNSGHIANSDQDCNGDCFGNATEDSCGECSGGNSGHEADSDIDCFGICFGGAVEDCTGLCGGTAIVDNCGDCVEGDTGLDACVQDCNGIWGGSAIENECGCVGGDTGLDPSGCWGCTDTTACNYSDTATQDDGSCLYLDCAGECGGAAYLDGCGECDSNPDNDNLSCLDPEMINTFYPITQSNYSTTDCSGEPYEIVDSDPDSWVETLLADGTWSSLAFGIPAAYGIWYTPDATTMCFTYNQYRGSEKTAAEGSRMNRTEEQRDLQCIQYEKLHNPVGDLLEVIYTYQDMGDPACYIQVFGVYSGEDCAGVPGGDAQLDDCGVCSGGTTGHEANSDMDCTGECFGTAVNDDFDGCCQSADIDDCGVCFGNNTEMDCEGICFGEAFVDDCAVCSGGTTGHEANSDMDDCGICFGENADMDCEGVCFGEAFFDDCGVCSGGTTGHAPDSDLDCTGECFGTAVNDAFGGCCQPDEIDDCGVCLGNNADLDCFGDCFGEAFENECGCVGGNTGLETDFCYGCMDETAANYDPNALFPCEPDCCTYNVIPGCMDDTACNYNPGATDDDGSCLYYDCAGECGGTAVNDDFDGCCQSADIDDCGVCFGSNMEMDCDGICFGEAFVDDCAVCSGGTTGHEANSDMDDCGVCFGENMDLDCNGDCFGEAFENECGCVGGSTGLSDDFCYGCMDFNALNYDPEATIQCDPDCCVYEQTELGCTDPEALNYDVLAIEDDGSCLYMGDMNADGVVDVSDVLVMVDIILSHRDPTDWEYLAGDYWLDGRITIFDIVFLVEQIINAPIALAEPITFGRIEIGQHSVSLITDGMPAGIQLNVVGEFTLTDYTLPAGWELYRSSDRILLISFAAAPLDSQLLFRYDGDLQVEEALIADWQHNNQVATISVVPDVFGLKAVYPNPFNPVTTITFDIPVETLLSLAIYDLNGNKIADLLNESSPAGRYSLSWDGSAYPSGIYFVKLVTAEFSETRKIMLLK